MKVKAKSNRELDYVYRPIVSDDYPEEVVTDNFTYYRIYCTLYAILYEKYRGEVRVSYHILPQEKDIYSLDEALKYADSQKGEQVCRVVLR